MQYASFTWTIVLTELNSTTKAMVYLDQADSENDWKITEKD